MLFRRLQVLVLHHLTKTISHLQKSMCCHTARQHRQAIPMPTQVLTRTHSNPTKSYDCKMELAKHQSKHKHNEINIM